MRVVLVLAWPPTIRLDGFRGMFLVSWLHVSKGEGYQRLPLALTISKSQVKTKATYGDPLVS